MTQQEYSRKLDSLFTMTWYDIRRSLADQAFQIIPLYNLLVEKGKVKSRAPDGTHWEIPVQYDKLNQNTKWFGKGSTFGTAEKEFATSLLYQIRYIGTSVVRYWMDDNKNRGKAKVLDYLNSKLANVRASFTDTLETDMWVQNADPQAMTALPTLISTTPTASATVGGLDRSQNPWMANQVYDFTGKTFSTDFRHYLTNVFHSASKYKAGTRRSPDIILTTQDIYEKYEDICNSMQRIVASDSIRASLGFGNLSFKGIEMYWAPQCPAGTVWLLNSEHLEFAYDPAAFMEMTEWKPIQGTSLDKTAQIVTACQMLVDNFQKHGVMFNVS